MQFSNVSLPIAIGRPLCIVFQLHLICCLAISVSLQISKMKHDAHQMPAAVAAQQHGMRVKKSSKVARFQHDDT